MGASLHRRHGIIGMAVGIGGDADQVGLGGGQGLGVVVEERIAFQSGGQRARAAVDQTDDLELRILVIGKGVALAHVAKACDKDTDHLTAPAVMPRINCREKIR